MTVTYQPHRSHHHEKVKLCIIFVGAFAVVIDAVITVAGPVLLPHLFAEFHASIEATVGAMGKCGAAFLGIIEVSERMIRRLG